MAIRDYNKCLTIIDATTGDVICTVKTRLYTPQTIREIIGDIFTSDYNDTEHGIMVKYGIEP